MHRMLTLTWAFGALLFASHAQALTPMGEIADTARVAAVVNWNNGESAGAVLDRARTAEKAEKIDRPVSEASRDRSASRSVSQSSRARNRRVERVEKPAHRPTAQGGQWTRAESRRTIDTSANSSFMGRILTGIASFYWQPQRVASGGWFNPNAMTAAHKTLPFGTRVRVTHARNGRSVDVTINDRGPYVGGRIIDLSSAAAGAIGMKGSGIAQVKLEVLGR